MLKQTSKTVSHAIELELPVYWPNWRGPLHYNHGRQSNDFKVISLHWIIALHNNFVIEEAVLLP